MYIIFLIALVGLVVSWLPLRRLTRIWIQRPITASESIVAGTSAWLFLFSLLAWFGGIGLTFVNCIFTYKIIDIGILLVSILLTVFVMNSFIRSRYDMRLDDTQDFFKEAIQFRRSEHRRLDVLSLMHKERKHKDKRTVNNAESRERRLLQADLDKEKEQETQLTLLRKGTGINMSELWHIQTQSHSSHPLYEKVQEVRIDPNKKRLSLYADFPGLNEEQLKDETTVLRLNREMYDFFQSMNAEPWLKPYTPYFESYFMICRAIKKIPEGTDILYPFMKVEILISELRKLEGSYFNPRKLSEITTLTFNGGAQL
jgi:hypothetical protein